MMNKATVGTMIFFIFVLVCQVQAGVSVILNSSFENDGAIPDITTDQPPQYWCDVNMLAKFSGWVGQDWYTHKYKDSDGYSLTLYTGFGQFKKGEMATISQQVYLRDVQQIIFDLGLSTIGGYPWDSNDRSIILVIDNNDVIWDSADHWPPDENGEFLYATADINDRYSQSFDTHTLSLAIRANKDKDEYFYEFVAHWDAVRFNAHCEGSGYDLADIDRDCCVDANDLAMLAQMWLLEGVEDKYDLFEDSNSTVNYREFAFLADEWLWIRGDYYSSDEDTMLRADLNCDGIVDLQDFAIFAQNWQAQNCCMPADMDNSGDVDGIDMAIMANEWLQKNWLYGL